MTFRFGVDNLLADDARLALLKKARVGLIAHPASVTGGNRHSVDALIEAGCHIVRAFGPQHGMRGDKQDNMVESEDYVDAVHQLPVTSLYGAHRSPTDDMLRELDIVLFDLQDIGCRIYTYITTLYYFARACARLGKPLWVLDRPNPAGRPIDGLYLEDGEQSFVGCAPMPTRHGLTVGELAGWFSSGLDLDLTVITMSGYQPDEAPGFGWPLLQRPWINPSPNAAGVNMARCFPGTVLLEGTTLSEGRGTTRPLEVMGAPGLPAPALLAALNAAAPEWCDGVYLRECFFAPTFHKHQGELCAALQIHTDYPGYNHRRFKPYRLIAGLLKALRLDSPDYELWRYHDYEYELTRTPIDVINGGPRLREWVDNPDETYNALARELEAAERDWRNEREEWIAYR